MGYVVHKAIVLTAFDDEIEYFHQKARNILGKQCSPIVKSIANGYASFFIATDGSKDGWETCEESNVKRNRFLEWVESNGNQYSCDWVEIEYGADSNAHAKVVRDSKYDSRELGYY